MIIINIHDVRFMSDLYNSNDKTFGLGIAVTEIDVSIYRKFDLNAI